MAEPQSQTLSLWMKSLPPLSTGKLTRGLEVDVCVIGGGIAGLTTAYFLTKAAKRVVVLEKDLIGSGESGRTTGHITHVLDDRYLEIEKTHGLDQSRLAAAAHSFAMDEIETIAREENIDCGLKRVAGYLVAGRAHDTDYLKREAKAVKRAGIEVGWHDLDPRGTFSGPALVFPNQLQFEPMAYLHGLVGGRGDAYAVHR